MSPRYVEFGALMTPPPPFRSLRTSLWGFSFRADPDRLRTLTQRLFDDTTGGAVSVRPLGTHVMLTWGRIERVSSLAPGWEARGGVAEPQVVIWIPVVRDGRFSMFVPYLWVDNAMSLATGRELFGYPKSWSWIGFPDVPDQPPIWTVDAFGLNFHAGELAARHPLLRIQRGDTIAADAQEHHSLLEIAKHMASSLWGTLRPDHLLADLELVPQFAQDIAQHEFPHVFLKQFRSIEDGTEACLQQVTECRYRIARIHARPSLHEHSLTVYPLDSQPLIDELGLESQETHLAYELDMDFDVGWGRVLWDASVPSR